MAANGVRGGSGIQRQTAGETVSGDSLSNIATLSGETDGGTEGKTDGETRFIPGSTSKTTGPTATTTQAGPTAGSAADPMATSIASPKDIPALPDMAARGNDLPAQTNAPGTNQNSIAAAFGSELKLAGEASPATETAAARNTPNPAVSQVAVQINRAVQDGQDKFVVNLKPATLGKVSVQLEVGHDNRVIAVIAAERPETLDLLQRDSRALELALKEAGLKTDSGSLSFSLQGDEAEDSPFENQSGSNHAIAIPQDGDDLNTLPIQNTHAYAIDASGVDIHV
jgi:flagellar hook-length control protein FliK